MPKTELDKLFEERYKKLNPEQKLAVDSIEGPVMVIAGPGTGKTTILTLRIANILKRTDTPPSGILALTFTESGVKAIRVKLREIIGSRADEVAIHTFHGFAGSVISEFPDHFPHLHLSKQITDVEAEVILRDILKNKKYSKLRPIGEPDFYLSQIISTISDAKKEAWSPEDLSNFAKEEIKRIESDESSISTRGASKGKLKADALKRIEKCEKTLLFADVFAEYEKKKTEDRKMDFDDLLFELVRAVKEDKLLLQLLQEKFLYILVDEHQDTNDSQNLIVSTISNFFDSPNIFVVGDEKQAIYRFQGASVENFLKFQKTWKDMKVISLESNFRSHQHILDAVFPMIEENYLEGEYKDLRKKLKSGVKTLKKPIDIVLSKDSDSSDAFLLDEIKNIQKKDKDASIAVILRKNKDVDHILALCEAGGVEASAERGVDIFTHPFGVLYFKILEYIDDPSRLDSLAGTLASGLWGLKLDKSIEIIKKIKSGNTSSIEKDIPELALLREEALKEGPISFFIKVAEFSGLVSPNKSIDPVTATVWRNIINLTRDIADSKNLADSSSLIKELLNYKKTREKKVIKIGGGKISAKVEVMTAHGSKGLEYDYVFLPYATEEYWTPRARGSVFVLPREKDSSDEIKDARRLFYVALTRARKHVVVMVPSSDGLGREFTPLRFVSELHPESVKKQNIEQTKELPKSTNKNKNLEIVEYAKRVLTENGLSVTALNHFNTCPSQFLYKSILKLPEAPSPSSEKGIAMHKALALIWRSEDKSPKKIEEIINKTVTDYIENSLLAKHDKDNVLEELLKSSTDVAQSLSEHFSQPGQVFTEKWVERVFESQKQKVSINLHGQLDAIVITDKKIFVFDYKTKKAMTINAIKGETQNEDGGYWRQLIFYKLLLADHHQYKDKEIEPALVFIKPDEKGRCPIVSLPIDKEDCERVLAEVNTLVDSVYSGDFMDRECDDKKCQFCAMKKYYKAS